MVPVKAGDVVFIPPGPDVPAPVHQHVERDDAYLSISTQEEPEICEYPDSGKYGAFAKGFRGAQRTSANLDYWDGEP